MKKNLILLILIVFTSLYGEIIVETDFTGTFPPPGWQTTSSSGQINWQQSSSNNAGGTQPEAEFNWSPSTVAVQRLACDPVNTVGATELELEFKHSINDFDGNYTLRLETSSDGLSWNTVTTFPSSDLPATTENITVTTPDVGSANFQIAWVFDGDSYNINYWYIDDIILEGTLITYDNDLAGMEIEGPMVANAGNTVNYDVTVKNVGYNVQNSYTVKLMRNNELLNSIDINAAIAPDEIVTHTLSWNIPGDEPQGTTSLHGAVELQGDENTANDATNEIDVQIFPPGVIEINVGNGTENNDRTPVCFQYKNSLSETIIFEDELGISESFITQLTYYTNFNNDLYNKPTKIWIGETTQTNLTSGWIPASSLTQVFDGTINYLSSQNSVTIEFDNQYYYEGDNLVIMAFRPMDDQTYGSSCYFLHTETTQYIDRTRYERDDDMVLDPYDPPTGYSFEKFANVTITFFQGAMGNVEGYVTADDGTPIEGAEIEIDENQMITFSDADGYYFFGNITVGNYTFTASKYGYSPDVQTAEVLEDQTIQLDFELIPLGQVSVSGNVVGSDAPSIGLENAVVTLDGFANYEVFTDQNGDFQIDDVYTNIDYDLVISYEDYQTYEEMIQVGSTSLDLGTIVLSELAYPPGNVFAEQNDPGTLVDLTWSSPGQGGGEFRYDDGEVDFQIGFSENYPNGVFGAVHPNISIIQEIQWYLTSDYQTHDNVKLYIFGLDNEGKPNQQDLIFDSGYVDNIDDEWNVFELPEQIEAYEGFCLGISTPNEYTSLALDDGENAPWEFQFGTHFSITDWTDENETWQDIGDMGGIFQKNMFLRAYGVNLGNTARVQKTLLARNERLRSFEGYNIYRFPETSHNNPDEWELIGEIVTDTTFTDLTWDNLPNDVYQYAIRSVHTNNIESIPAFSNLVERTTAFTSPDELIPATKLLGNFPNPFNPSTTIYFNITQNPTSVNLEIYNIKGQKIRKLEITEEERKNGSISWDGKDQSNELVGSGIYFYHLTIDQKIISSKRMLLLK